MLVNYSRYLCQLQRQIQKLMIWLRFHDVFKKIFGVNDRNNGFLLLNYLNYFLNDVMVTKSYPVFKNCRHVRQIKILEEIIKLWNE